MKYDGRWKRLTGHKLADDDFVDYSDELAYAVEEIHPSENETTLLVLRTTELLVEQYPDVPQLRNYLSIHHKKLGNDAEVVRVNERAMRDFPDYFFARSGLAEHYLAQKQPAMVPRYLDFAKPLEHYVPREIIHLSEFRAFYALGVRYYSALGKIDRAKDMLRPLVLVQPDHAATKAVARELETARLTERFANLGKSIEAEKPGSYHYEPRTEAPKLHHDELEFLREPLEGIPLDEIGPQLDQLPRETVVADLHTLLDDFGHRLSHYRAVEEEEDLPGWELFAPDLLLRLFQRYADATDWNRVLSFFRQSEEVLSFWFADFGTFEMIRELESEWLQHLPTEALFDAILNPTHDAGVAEGLEPVVVDRIAEQPDLRARFAERTEAAFQQILTDGTSTPRYGSGQTNALLSVARDLGLTELLPTVAQLFDAELLFKNYMGNLDAVQIEFERGAKSWAEFQQQESKKVRYSEFVKSIEQKLSKSLLPKATATPDDPVDAYLDKLNVFRQMLGLPDPPTASRPVPSPPVWRGPAVTFQRSDKKVGRNDPCPCGSGRKYKKCCLRK